MLVIGAEKLTSITNWTDRNTCVLFGDGAGAAILRHRGGSAHGVISTHIGSDGEFTDILFMPGGGCDTPITRENVDTQPANDPHDGQGSLQTSRHRHAARVARKRSIKPA